jgi:exodeoxyribonuclease VII small subunit
MLGREPAASLRAVHREPRVSAEPADIAAMPFEAAIAELESIVDRLEKGNVTLEESIQLYERGEALKGRCDVLLKDAEMRIEKITLGADGKPTGLVPLDEK